MVHNLSLYSGATVSRGDQYDVKTVPYGRTSYWTGTLKSNPAVVDSGAIFGPSASGGYRYHETIRKDGQIIVEMEARECVRVGNVAPPVASNSPSIRTVIPMLQEGGTFVVPATINGKLTLNFVVDSGAADVSIPADVVMTLFRTGTITDADFLGKEIYKMADGSAVPSQQFIIHSLKVGDNTLENVTASISPVTGSLLLGQSFLGRFHSWSIDNQSGVLTLN
jgi:clan AA aspartic protease (TIGR02281 family)